MLITETEGFWDKENFKDHKNIFFAKNNYLQTWVADISAILNLSEVKINEVISCCRLGVYFFQRDCL